MKGTKLKRMLEAGERGLNAWSCFPSPLVAEVLAHQAFDSITIDMQHGPISFDSALGMLQAISATDVTPIIRPPSLEPGIIMAVLDAGAMGIICPLINTAEQARALVSACRYPPQGTRSFGPLRASLVAGPDYFKKANDAVLVFAMIETREGMQNLAEILAVEGLDGVYIGPSDLSLTHGLDPMADIGSPGTLGRIDLIRETAHQMGKKVGMHSSSIDYCVAMWNRGFDFVTAPSDVGLMNIGSAALMSALDR
ncbi:2,4-dihydroxyhept-2-ene-1,7-dioic acid aldolase [Acetobacteraceae bacterium H6797]|nr:2,4-dihydroxyhept-2-ene-1,7-dioic acid aldolase [Acetobacteraceae bacterium H6797]